MSESILVTGASGYIGSHTVLALIETGHKVIAMENSNSVTLGKVEELTNKNFTKVKCNLLNLEDLKNIFKTNKIDTVIHLAALKSTQSPVEFYKNNIVCLINLLEVMNMHKVKKLIFGSSCGIYGDQKILPVPEYAVPCPQNVYARTKYFAEEMLRDVSRADENLSVIILRYFNPIGAHMSGKLGEDPNGKQLNILTLFAKNALGTQDNLKISPECARDFIHVMDVAEVHIEAVRKLNEIKGIKIYNVGSGVGTSLKELIEAFERINEVKINYTSKSCGESEIKAIIADTKLMEDELKFKVKHTIEEMCRDCWKFNENLK